VPTEVDPAADVDRLGVVSYAPMSLTIPTAAILLALALPAAVAASRGWTGRLTRLGRLGLHTPAALASDEAFALANRVSAPLVAGAAITGVVCAIVAVALPLGTLGAITVLLLGLAGLLVQQFGAARMGDRAARTVPLPARKPGAGGGCCGGCGCGEGGCGASHAGSARDAIPDLRPDATLH
jgi:hypothetical protein